MALSFGLQQVNLILKFHKDLEILVVKEEIKRRSSRYLQRLSNHSNPLAISLLDDSEEIRRLKRVQVLDLPFGS